MILKIFFLNIAAGSVLFLIDAIDVLAAKSHLFNNQSQKIIFLILFSGVSVIFSSIIALIQSTFYLFVKRMPLILAKILVLTVFLAGIYTGLEYGTYFHKARIIGILFICGISGYLIISVLFGDIRRLIKNQPVKNYYLKTSFYALSFFCLYWINSRMFFNQNFILHLTLVSAMFLLAELIIFFILKNKALPVFKHGLTQKTVLIFLAGSVIFSLFAFDLSQNVKHISFDQTSTERFILYSLKRIFDFDRDKYSSLFGGGDPDDFDPSRNPEMTEIRDNGIDENGFCGDLKRENGSDKNTATREGYSPSNGKIKTEDCNIVLIIIDALRPDHTGTYFYPRDTTPFIDEFAKDAFVFDNAYAQACHTRTSMPSFMLSQYQPFAGKKWDHRGKTLAELLKENGYRTISVIFYKLGNMFTKGYDVFSVPGTDPEDWNTSDPFIPLALKNIDDLKEGKFFLWMHLPYPHHPYVNHKESPFFGKSDKDRYDSEIRYTDGLLKEFYNLLAARNLTDKTIFILLADHGEEFGDHGGKYHNSTAYNEQIHVPLIIKIPGMKGKRIKENVRLIDLTVTCLNMAGIEKKEYHQGHSFMKFFFGEDPQWDNQILSGPIGSFQKFTLIKDGRKLIYNTRNNFYELYDLNNDPYEKNNLIDTAQHRNSYGNDLIEKLHRMIEINNCEDTTSF